MCSRTIRSRVSRSEGVASIACEPYYWEEGKAMPPDQPTPYLRASDADREAAAERLRVASVEGRLESEELEQRLAGVYAARWVPELARLTADITPPPPAAPPVPYGYGPPVASAPP